MDVVGILLLILFAWALFQALRAIARERAAGSGKLPPGPIPFPIIGSLHKLGNKPHQSLGEMAKIYGPIMSIKLGQMTTVVISSPALAQQVLQKQDLAFANRAVPDSVRASSHDRNSVAWIPVSAQWRSLRKICNSHIFSAQKLDANRHLRQRKVEELVSEVGERCSSGSAMEINLAAFKTSLNLLSNTFFSVDLAKSTESDITGEFKETVTRIMEEVGKPNLVDYFPALARIDPMRIRSRLTVEFSKVFKMFDQLISQRLEAKKMHGYRPSNDVLDTLLSISEAEGDVIERSHVEHLILDLFLAGTDTTSSTIEWAMAELMRHPKVLSKAQEELRQAIGRGKVVEESDVALLPYLQAIVKETLRLHPSAPLLLPRKVDTDVQVFGYTVPKNAQVLVNAWAIGRDQSTWENPDEFMPERFLGSEVDVRGRHFELIPFGGGRRICAGLPLALRMIHLILASLLNSFDWRLEDGVSPEELGMEEEFGITLRKAQPLRLVPVSL